MRNKLKNNKGFSISEMLMVVLILALMVSIIGGGVVVVKNAYENIIQKADAQTLLSTAISEVTDEYRYAINIEEKEVGDVGETSSQLTFQRGNLEVYLTYVTVDDTIYPEGAQGQIILVNSANPADVETLVSNKTLVENMTLAIDEQQWHESTKSFTAVISVKKDGETIIDSPIKVKAINER